MDRLGIDLIRLALSHLGEIADDLVLVGGAVTGLLITDPAAPSTRLTDDVDAIVHISSLVEYSVLAERLTKRGFNPDPLLDCRYRHGELTIDVMPTTAAILGFSNRWYASAIDHAETKVIDLRTVRHIDAIHFIATKLTAFADRGRGDYFGSHDLEDVFTVINGRSSIVEEMRKQAEGELKEYLRRELDAILRHGISMT